MSMVKSERTFLPAAGRDWFLPLYDPFTRLFGFDATRQTLLDQGAVQPHHRVLDIGCGTGTLTVLIKQQHPDVDVVGLDPDPAALARAQRKAERAGVTVRFDLGCPWLRRSPVRPRLLLDDAAPPGGRREGEHAP